MSSSESDIDEEIIMEQERVIQIVKDIWNVRDVNDEGKIRINSRFKTAL